MNVDARLTANNDLLNRSEICLPRWNFFISYFVFSVVIEWLLAVSHAVNIDSNPVTSVDQDITLSLGEEDVFPC